MTRFISRSETLLSNGTAIVTKDVQLRPLIQDIVDRVRHGMLGQQLLFPPQKLLPQLGQYRGGFRLSQSEPLVYRTILGLPLHSKQSADQLYGLACNLGRHLPGINYLPAGMGPAAGARDRIAGHNVRGPKLP
jgi:hypothetical protein